MVFNGINGAITKVLPYGKALCHEPHIYPFNHTIMPNWCENTLTVKIDNADEVIKEITSEENLDFSLIVEVPDTPAYRNEYEVSQDEIRNDDTFWYDWNIKNWGTKWNASDSHIEWVDDSHFIIAFQTAWSPPTPIVYALSEKYPNAVVGLEYREYGMDFEGVLICQNGKTLVDESRDCLPVVDFDSLEYYEEREDRIALATQNYGEEEE